MSRLKDLFSLYAPEYAHQAENAAMEVQNVYKKFSRYINTSVPSGINHYHCYPYLFSAAFPSVSEENLHWIAVAGVLYLDHLCILDRMVDAPSSIELQQPILGALLHEQSGSILRKIFTSDSKFWNELELLNIEHCAAVMREKRAHRFRVAAYQAGEFFSLAIGKSGVSKATHVALAYIADTFDSVDALSRSQDNFNAAFQAYDDVKDWKEDLHSGNYSDLLTRVLIDMGISANETIDCKSVSVELSHHLYYSGVIENVLEQAMEYCKSAQSAVDGLPVLAWIKLNKAFSTQIEKLHDDLQRTRLQTILRSRGILTRKHEDLMGKGLAYLLHECACGYPEAEHSMGFLWHRADGLVTEVQSGSVFQRAILTDILLDAQDAGLIDFSRESVSECNILLNLRLKNVRGGWSYFPALESLPPDADDLGQVMQVMARTNHPEISRINDDIDLLFENCAEVDGSFETWIVDYKSNSQATQSMIYAIENSWGSGKDVEVIANLCYGLLLYSPRRYSDRIQAAVKYVESQQTESGHWIPTWYASSYYGTYAAARFLFYANRESNALKRTAERFPTCQHSDGGFGDDSSTPMETALALLIIHFLPMQDEDKDKIVAKATRYLELTMRDDGTWNASNFIQMDSHRAQRGKPGYSPQWLYYKSRTITTGYVIKALIASRKDK